MMNGRNRKSETTTQSVRLAATAATELKAEAHVSREDDSQLRQRQSSRRCADARNVGQCPGIGIDKAELNSSGEPSLEVHLKRVVV